MLMYGFISIQAHLNTIGLSVGDLSKTLQRYITLFTLLLNSHASFHTAEIFGHVCVFIWWWRESRKAIVKASWVQKLLRGNWFSLSLFFIPCLHFFCETSCTFSSSLFFCKWWASDTSTICQISIVHTRSSYQKLVRKTSSEFHLNWL